MSLLVRHPCGILHFKQINALRYCGKTYFIVTQHYTFPEISSSKVSKSFQHILHINIFYATAFDEHSLALVL